MNVVASEKSRGNDITTKQLENCIVLQNSLESRGEVHGEPSSETQGQIVGARESLNRRENMAQEKSKER